MTQFVKCGLVGMLCVLVGCEEMKLNPSGPDAGTVMDASSDAGADSSVGSDSGPEPDASVDAGVKPDAGPSTTSCLDGATPVLGLSGSHGEQYDERDLSRGTGLNAWGGVWDGVDNWPIYLIGEDVCWSGGYARTRHPETASWDAIWHHSGALNFEGPNFVIEGFRAHHLGDGIRVRKNASGFVIRDVYLSHMHDDCLENDELWGGTTENSLFDGCYVAISARTDSDDTTSDGSRRVWQIRNNLFRLEPMAAVYKPEKYGSPGHGGFFKWEKDNPEHALKVSVHNNIFRVDQDANHGDLGINPDIIESCSNNTVVWLGKGTYPDSLPSCFTITTDEAVWDNAVSNWKSQHPEFN